VAKRLATRLGYDYLDTGGLYRAVAWKVSVSGVQPADSDALAAMLATTRVTVEPSAARPRVLVDGQDVSSEIRSPEISRMASVVSAIPAVREWLLPVQRALAPNDGGMVAEGRDLGTRVFPKADVKFFLEADVAVRAGRRHQELVATGHERPLAQTTQEIHARDARDRGREIAPLVAAPDATVIDTTTLDVEQVVERMMAVIATRP
jgi:cytidylate kinase